MAEDARPTDFWRDYLVCAECGARAHTKQPVCQECGFGVQERQEGEDESSPGPISATPKWWLYIYVDPSTWQAIYVGITMDPSARHSSHMGDSQSAVWNWMLEHNVTPRMVRIGEFPNRKAARVAEECLIACVPNLANRDVFATKRRVRSVLGGQE